MAVIETIKKEIRYKTGIIWQVGEQVKIEVMANKPTDTIMTNLTTGRTGLIPTRYLHRHFDGFIELTDNVISEAVMCDCQTIRGELIEPDGWDTDGMPSILLAMALI